MRKIVETVTVLFDFDRVWYGRYRELGLFCALSFRTSFNSRKVWSKIVWSRSVMLGEGMIGKGMVGKGMVGKGMVGKGMVGEDI